MKTKNCSVNTSGFNFTNLLFCSLNVKGQGNETKRKSQYQWLRNLKSDINFLQETHSSKKTECIWKNQWGGECFFAHGETNARGVAILFKRGLSPIVLDNETDPHGTYLWLKVDINGTVMGLLNIYSPNLVSDQVKFYEKIIRLLESKQDTHPIFIGGDFNCTLNPKKDKKGGSIAKKQRTVDLVNEIMEEHYLTDVWRNKNPYKREYTWSQNKPTVSCRLDMWLIPYEFLQITKFCKITTAILTDHKAVVFNIEGKNFRPRGPGLWKLNTSVLDEEEYKKGIIKLINEHKKDSENIDPRYVWQELKHNIGAFSMTYCQARSKMRKQREIEVKKKLEQLEKTLHNLKKEELEEYHKYKSEYENLYDSKAKGSILRSRAKWAAEGEKSSSYFFGLEKRNFNSQCITQLDLGNEEIIDNPKQILTKIYEFYRDLYSTNENSGINCEINDFFNFDAIPKLNEEEIRDLEKPITLEECQAALLQMADSKSPGIDGLPAEFYKTFWPYIKDTLLTMYTWSYEMDQFLGNVQRGIIRLLPKPLLNLLFLCNWRPITLLNVDYKIISKVLANRLKKVINKLVHEDQTGFVKGRYIGISVRTLLEVADYCEDNELPGLLVSLDIQKAFDSLDWNFLCKALTTFGIGPQFLKWIELMYVGATSQVINNGYTTKEFDIERGVRQGDPISPYLFILAIELLATAIRNKPEIEGIEICGEITKLVQFADDTTVLLKNDNSFIELATLLEKFGNCSGLKLNQRKTIITGLGKWKKRSDKILEFKISPDPIKILGIWFSHDKKRMQDLNVGGKLSKIKKTLSRWHSRGLTIQGKILIMKALGLSQLTYVMINTCIPIGTLHDIQKYVYEFIWQGKNKATVKRSVMIQDYKDGGLKAPDLITMYKSLKYSWITRLICTDNYKWRNIEITNLEAVGGIEYLLLCNFKTSLLPIKQTNEFLLEILTVYSEIHSKNVSVDLSKKEINNQRINNNQCILVNGKSLFIQELADKNMDKISDWLNQDGTFLSYKNLKQRVATITWFQYIQIVHAIPKGWKLKLKNQQLSHAHQIREQIPSSGAAPKNKIKELLLKRQAETPVGITGWNHVLGSKQSKSFWEKVFVSARKTSKEVKLQVFQFKVLHRTLATQLFLYHRKIVTSPICKICTNETENVEHMLFLCCSTKKLWEDIAKLFELRELDIIQPTLKNCVFGVLDKGEKNNKWNIIALNVRFFSYKCKYNGNEPTLEAFLAAFKCQLNLLLVNIFGKENITKFKKYWSHWL
jgi:exonuclease III